jgi:hypothetical protein
VTDLTRRPRAEWLVPDGLLLLLDGVVRVVAAGPGGGRVGGPPPGPAGPRGA